MDKTLTNTAKSQSNFTSNEVLKILFVGRISKDNGVGKYVEILNLLKKEKINFVFESLGDGDLRADLKHFGKVNGFVINTSQYIQKADIIFASSYLSILESLKYQKMVISVFDNPLKYDYLNMSPFRDLVIITDDAQIAVNKIIKFKNKDSMILEMTKKGQTWAETQTWKKLAQEYTKLWANI